MKRAAKQQTRMKKLAPRKARERGAVARSKTAPRVIAATESVPNTARVQRWREQIARNGWTLDTMPLDRLAAMLGRIAREHAAALLGVSLDALAARAATAANTPPVARVRRTAAERADATRERIAALVKKRETVRASLDMRPLTNDRALAVPLNTLAPGTRFKTPDDVRIGVRGVYSVLRFVGAGGASIARTERIGDYIAGDTMVVPLGADVDGAP